MERIVERERARARARAGYTLVELMMIVMIIGVSVLVFTPGFSRAMADRRVSLATRELIRVGRRARADTFGYLRAHLLWIDPATRTVQLLRGPTNSCTFTNWVDVSSDCTTGATLAASAQRCVENLYLSNLSGQVRTISIFEDTLVSGAVTYSTTGRALCFQPSGLMMFGSGANLTAATVSTPLNGANTAAVGGGFVFSLVDGSAAPDGSNAALRIHRVLFPMGGSARSLR